MLKRIVYYSHRACAQARDVLHATYITVNLERSIFRQRKASRRVSGCSGRSHFLGGAYFCPSIGAPGLSPPDPPKEIRKGTMGSALMGSLQISCFGRGTFWALPLINLCLYSQNCQGVPFSPTCQNSLLLPRPH